MYETFYGFKEKPFSMLPDPSFLFLSKKHRAALTLLEYGLMNQVGFCILSGEPGAGKTTILRALLNRVDDNVTIGLISNTHQSFGGLLDWILSAFDLHKANLTQVEMHQLFVDFLIDEFANNRRVLLIVDEAQNMDPDSLEELRMLSNVNTDKDQLLQVVLAGQPQLKENLRKPELSQFAQRIAVDYHLHSLNLNETCGYIQHRLVVAGAERDVFTPEACERIHCYSGGSPRLINLLCETALVYGFADDRELIDADLVEEMVHERMEDSVVPLANRDGNNEASGNNTDQLVKDFPWIRPEGGTKGLKPEVKAKLAGAVQAKKITKSEVAPLSESVPAVSTEQVQEVELIIPNDVISQAEILGSKVVSDVDVPKNGGVAHEEEKSEEDISLTTKKMEPVVSDPVTNGSAKIKEAYEKEMFAKEQINAAKPKKSNVLKYLIYISLAVLGFALAALFFSGYTRDFGVFEEENNQVLESGSNETRLNDQIKDNSGRDVNVVDVVESDVDIATKENENKAELEKLEQARLEKEKLENEALEQEKLEQEKLEQEKLEQKKLAKLAQEKAEKEAEKKILAREKIEQEQVSQEKAEKEQAAQIIEFRVQEKREARNRDAEAKRKIARQIKQREAKLEAQEQARRRKLEAARIEKEKSARWEAANKIKQEQEARRLEKEWLEDQRAQLRATEAIENSTEKKTLNLSDEGFVSKPEKKTFSNCDGPAARFKSDCR